MADVRQGRGAWRARRVDFACRKRERSLLEAPTARLDQRQPQALRASPEALRVIPSGVEAFPTPLRCCTLTPKERGSDYFRRAKELWHPPDVQLPIEHVNYHFRDRHGEHLFAYDAEALANLLGRAGFVRVHPAGRDAAIDPESREAGTIRLVGIKP